MINTNHPDRPPIATCFPGEADAIFWMTSSNQPNVDGDPGGVAPWGRTRWSSASPSSKVRSAGDCPWQTNYLLSKKYDDEIMMMTHDNKWLKWRFSNRFNYVWNITTASKIAWVNWENIGQREDEAIFFS